MNPISNTFLCWMESACSPDSRGECSSLTQNSYLATMSSRDWGLTVTDAATAGGKDGPSTEALGANQKQGK